MVSKTGLGRGRNKCRQKHDSIIQAAIECFLGSGYNGAKMELIAEMAGVSKQTLYSHFSSKEGLFKAAIKACCEEQNLVADLFQREAGCAEILLDFAQAFSGLISSDAAISSMRTVISEAEQYPDIAIMFYSAGPLEIKQLLSDYLQSQCDAGILAIDNLAFAVTHLIALCKGEMEFRSLLNLDTQQVEASQPEYLKVSIDAFMKVYAV